MQKSKSFLCLIIAVLCLFASCFGASALSKTFYISELQMSIDIPDYFGVSTRDTNPNMTEGIYLEASSTAPDLDIRVLMQKDAKTEEFFNLSLLSSSALEEYKEAILSNPQYSDCTQGEYGGVLFLDFTTYDTVGDTTVYGRQSITVVNGMSIVIMSTSDSDALSSEEISLIRDVVSSVKFDKILSNKPGVTFWQVFIPIVIVLVVLVAGFLVFSYFMGKKAREEKKRRKKEMERRADYDVLSRAEKKSRTPQGPDGLGGYKTSGAFFDDAFSTENTKPASATDVPVNQPKNSTNSVVKGSKQAMRSTGYFFTNLKRELAKNKKNKRKPRKKAKPVNRKPQDYDVFSD